MRHVTLKVPKGEGSKIAKIAHHSGISEAAVYQVKVFENTGGEEIKDVVEFETATPNAKVFLDTLMSAPFYDPGSYSFSIRQPRSIVSNNAPSKLTFPIVMPQVDVFEELWQLSHINFSFIGRIFVAAILLSYGMVQGHLLMMAAGLLFLPYKPLLLATAFGAVTREWRLLVQGVIAFVVATVLIIGASVLVGFMMDAPIQYDQFGSLKTSFLFALALGVAAGLASIDDVGRRELIGLAVTAQLTVVPAWFGLSMALGFPEIQVVWERLGAYAVSLSTIIVSSGITYWTVGMRGQVINRFTGNVHERSRPEEEPGRICLFPPCREAIPK